MLFYYALTIAFVSSFLSSIVDLRIREIPNWLSHGVIILGILLRIYYSFSLGYWTLIEGILSGALLFGIGYLLYRLGQWGGGDVKLLCGMGVLFGLPTIDGFMLRYLIGIFITGGIWGALFAAYLLFKNFKKVSYTPPKFALVFSIIGIGVILFLSVYQIWDLVLICIGGLFLYWIYPLLLHLDSFQIKEISTKKVVEGDWLAEPITLNGKKFEKRGIGLTLEEVAIFHKYDKKVKVKDGLPFAPSFFFGLFFALYWFEILALVL